VPGLAQNKLKKCKMMCRFLTRRQAEYIFCCFVDALKETLMLSVVEMSIFSSRHLFLSAAFFSLWEVAG
jgi:hypothetical protein